MGKWLLRLLAAVLGTGLAAGLFCSFALVRVEGSDMLPTLEPGDYVLVSKWKKDNLAVGDLVLYEAPYYEIDGARYPLRRVVGLRDGWIQVGCDADLVRDSVQLIPAEYVVGTESLASGSKGRQKRFSQAGRKRGQKGFSQEGRKRGQERFSQEG